jgi:hypothetical protein
MILTERRGRVVNTPASYSLVPGSSLGPETGYPEFFVVFLNPFLKILGYYLKLGHVRLHPHRFQFVIDV